MKKKIAALILFSLIFIIGITVLPFRVLAVEDVDEQYPTVSNREGAEPRDTSNDIIPGILPKNIGKLKIDITGSTVMGYDANVNLDRYDEDGSVFLQQALGIYGTYPLTDIFTLRGGYDLTSIRYFKFSEANLLDNILSVGVDANIADDFVWSVDYMADFVGFPHDKFSEYTMNQVETSLKQNITDWLYHKIGYQFFIKDYPKWKTLNNWGNYRIRDRKDMRNTIWHQIGMYVGDKTFLKTDNQIYINDSNEQFLDYYDYKAIKTKVTAIHLLTAKLYAVGNAAYQYKDYYKRGVSDKETDQRDHLFIYGASLFYDITPNVSVGTNFDFRKNYSNENVQQYEDYVVSGGVYCAF